MTTAACLQVAEEDYGQLVDRENINREQDGVDASGMEAAIAALVIGDSTPEDRHPEKCVLKCCRAHEEPSTNACHFTAFLRHSPPAL